jgi:hypothetical protein
MVVRPRTQLHYLKLNPRCAWFCRVRLPTKLQKKTNLSPTALLQLISATGAAVQLRAVHHSTSLARIMAGDLGFFTLIQSLQRPAL